MFEPLAGVVDTAFIGHVGVHSLAALSAAVTLINTFSWIFNFLLHVPTQRIASQLGESSPGGVKNEIALSINLSFIIGILAVLIVWFGKGLFYSWLDIPRELYPLVNEYLSIRLLGHPFALAFMTALSLLRGMEKVKMSFYLVAAATLFNIVLTAIFIFILEMGLQGAALGTIVSTVLFFFVAMVLIHGEVKLSLVAFLKLPDRQLFKAFSRQSLGMFGRTLALSSSFFLATRAAGSMGVITLGAYQVVLQLWLFCSYFTDGMAITANVLGAKNWAKKSYKEAQIIFRGTIKLGGLLGMMFTLIYFLFDQSILGLFTDDQEILNKVSEVWWLIALAQGPAAVAYVYDGILFGLDLFHRLRFWMIVGFLFVFLPILIFAQNQESFLSIWVALNSLVLFRLATSFLEVRKSVRSQAGGLI